jgi:hypothetical protein
MKTKALVIAVMFLAGLAASVALAKDKPPKPESTHDGNTVTTSVGGAVTTTAPTQPKCDQVELKGTATSGSVTFVVTKANKKGQSLVGTTVALVVPANAKIKAKACTTNGVLTLRDLHVKVAPTRP